MCGGGGHDLNVVARLFQEENTTWVPLVLVFDLMQVITIGSDADAHDQCFLNLMSTTESAPCIYFPMHTFCITGSRSTTVHLCQSPVPLPHHPSSTSHPTWFSLLSLPTPAVWRTRGASDSPRLAVHALAHAAAAQLLVCDRDSCQVRCK